MSYNLVINEKMSSGDVELLALLLEQYGSKVQREMGKISRKIPSTGTQKTDVPIVYDIQKEDGSSVSITISHTLIPLGSETFIATTPKTSLGKGSFGTVKPLSFFITEGKDRKVIVQSAKTWVAKKLLGSANEQFLDIMNRVSVERDITQAMSPNANLVTRYRAVGKQSMAYLVMPLIQGENIEELIQKQSLTFAEVLVIAKSMLTELVQMKSLNIFHNDIKPLNMMYDKNLHTCKIIDYGAAVMGMKKDKGTELVYTQSYAALERMANPLHHSYEADLYSAGISIFEMLLSTLPNDNNKTFSTFRSINSNNTPQLISIIKQAFAMFESNQITSAEFKQSKDFWQAMLTTISENPKDRLAAEELLKKFPNSLLAAHLQGSLSSISDNINAKTAAIPQTTIAINNNINQLQKNIQVLQKSIDGKTINAMQDVQDALKAIQGGAPASSTTIKKLKDAEQTIPDATIVAKVPDYDKVIEALVGGLANIEELIDKIKDQSIRELSIFEGEINRLQKSITASNVESSWKQFVNILNKNQNYFLFFPVSVITAINAALNSEYIPITAYNTATVNKDLLDSQLLLNLISQIVDDRNDEFWKSWSAVEVPSGIQELKTLLKLSDIWSITPWREPDDGDVAGKFYDMLEKILVDGVSAVLGEVEKFAVNNNLLEDSSLLVELLIRQLESKTPNEAIIESYINKGANLNVRKRGKSIVDIAAQNNELSPYISNFIKGAQAKYRAQRIEPSLGKLVRPLSDSNIAPLPESLFSTPSFDFTLSRFKSKLEAYSFALSSLRKLLSSTNDVSVQKLINTAIDQIKVSIENHEQNVSVVTNIISALAQKISLKNDLAKLATDIDGSDFQQTPQEKFENHLARRFESQMAIELLEKPTTAMMNSVGRISKEILNIIDKLSDGEKQEYLQFLKEGAHVIAFGASSYSTIDDVKQILQSNDPKQLVKIMLLHFKFAQKMLRDINITTVSRQNEKPVGALLDIINARKSGDQAQPENFFTFTPNNKHASYIADTVISGSKLYSAIEGTRGRKGSLRGERQNKMGLLLFTQAEYDRDLPQENSARWVADAKSQEPNLSSPYVTDLINNDAVYVSGPSGMAALLLGQMECLGNFETVALKQNYLSAVIAYMVSGGFHSMHEILGPAQYTLKLVPGYNVSVPEKTKTAAPPNFQVFFDQQAKIDPEFSTRYSSGWDKYLNFFEGMDLVKILPLNNNDQVSVLVSQINLPEVLPLNSNDQVSVSVSQINLPEILPLNSNDQVSVSQINPSEKLPSGVAAEDLSKNAAKKVTSTHGGGSMVKILEATTSKLDQQRINDTNALIDVLKSSLPVKEIHDKVVALLKNKKADVNADDDFNSTAFSLALDKGADIAALLIADEAFDPNHQNLTRDFTPVNIIVNACCHQKIITEETAVKLLSLLIEKHGEDNSIDFNKPSRKAGLPVARAIASRAFVIAEFLLKAEAIPDLSDVFDYDDNLLEKAVESNSALSVNAIIDRFSSMPLERFEAAKKLTKNTTDPKIVEMLDQEIKKRQAPPTDTTKQPPSGMQDDADSGSKPSGDDKYSVFFEGDDAALEDAEGE